MVGMSGKVSEPRRGQTSQQKKAAVGSVGSGGSNKTQPPPEALHVANILGDDVLPDLGEKMAQVMAMLPSCSEEEVSIALHDNDYDTAKAITALLDCDTQSSSQGEWTTKKKSRRNKGGDGSSDFIIAPGDNRLSGRHSGRGTNRAASQNVRENFGGNVSVSGGGEGGRGRGGKGRLSSGGRGRSSSGRREREDKENKKEERGREREERGGQREERGGQREERGGQREERGGPRGERGARTRNRGPRASRNRSRPSAAEPDRSGEEGGRVEKTLPVPIATDAWEDLDPQPSTEWVDSQHHHQSGSPVAHLSTNPDPLESVDQTWDSEAESKGSQPLFPEAFSDPTAGLPVTTLPLATSLGSGMATLPTASYAQPTAFTATTTLPLLHQPTPTPIPRQPTPASFSCQTAPVEFQTTSSTSHGLRPHSRHKRLARSQIPSQPVEMPKGTYPELSELGIAFGGLELQLPASMPASRESSNSQQSTQEGLLATPTTNETRYTNVSVTSVPLTYSTQFPDDSGVISIATSSGCSGSGKKLEAPPGLPHPMAATLPHTITATSSLPHSSLAAASGSVVVPSGGLPHTVVPSGSIPHSAVPSGSLPHTAVHSGSLPHSVVPGGTLPHPIVSSGDHTVSGTSSLPHTANHSSSGPHAMPPTTTQETVVSTTGRSQLPTSATNTALHSQSGSSNVGQLLPPEPISLPPPSALMPPMDLPPSTDHSNKSTASSQLLPQPFSTVSASTGGGATDLLPTQTTPTSSMATPTSKALTAQSSSHHHSNQLQLQAQLQGGSKHGSVQQQQQQQAMIYPYMLQPPLVMPMSAYYDPNEMSRYQASVSMAYYQHPTTSDPAIATGIGRDHVGSGFGSEGTTVGTAAAGKYSTSTTPSNPPHTQQQGVQQGQMSHAAVFNPYYGGNVIYPMYHGYGMPGFSAHSMPKPSGGSSYPGGGVNSYQAPSGGGFGYEDVGSGQDYKMYGGMGSGLGKGHGMGSSSADMSGAGGYKHPGFDTVKAGSNYSTYSVPQGGYGFIPTGPVPLQMPPNYMPTHEGGGGGGGGRGQKHSKTYSGSHGNNQLWSQQSSH